MEIRNEECHKSMDTSMEEENYSLADSSLEVQNYDLSQEEDTYSVLQGQSFAIACSLFIFCLSFSLFLY